MLCTLKIRVLGCPNLPHSSQHTPPNIASNRRLEEGDPILARMDTYTGRICVEAVARATQGAGEEKF